MNVNCSTCLELLTPSDELSSVPCGHVFHTPCILQWLETGKNNCPQCRTRCRENQLRRVYFTEGVESSTQSDANTLQNRLDTVTFQLRCSESEKKSFKESVDELTAKNVGLKEEFKNLEKKYKKIKEEQATMRDQLKLYQREREKRSLAEMKAKNLEKKLEMYQSVKVAIDGTLPELMERLNSMEDLSDDARSALVLSEQLKKELINKSSEVSRLHKAFQRKSNECGEFKTKYEEQNRKVSEIMDSNNRLKSDFDHAEDENQRLKKKLEVLQEAIVSPSGDPKNSAIARLVSEFPAPLKLNMSIVNSPPKQCHSSPKASSGLIGLKQRQKRSSPTGFKRSASLVDPQNLFSKKPKLTSLSQPSSDTFKVSSRASLFHDGLGGRSKKEEFPSREDGPRHSSTSVKKKITKTVMPDRNLQTINKYFNFETP